MQKTNLITLDQKCIHQNQTHFYLGQTGWLHFLPPMLLVWGMSLNWPMKCCWKVNKPFINLVLFLTSSYVISTSYSCFLHLLISQPVEDCKVRECGRITGGRSLSTIIVMNRTCLSGCSFLTPHWPIIDWYLWENFNVLSLILYIMVTCYGS